MRKKYFLFIITFLLSFGVFSTAYAAIPSNCVRIRSGENCGVDYIVKDGCALAGSVQAWADTCDDGGETLLCLQTPRSGPGVCSFTVPGCSEGYAYSSATGGCTACAANYTGYDHDNNPATDEICVPISTVIYDDNADPKVFKAYSIDGWLQIISNLWQEDGLGNVFRDTGNVGIGTADPSEPLHVVGNVFLEAPFFQDAKLILDNSNIEGVNALQFNDRGVGEGVTWSGSSAVIDIVELSTGDADWVELPPGTPSGSGTTSFGFGETPGSWLRLKGDEDGMILDPGSGSLFVDGNVGIGTAWPLETLTVVGGSGFAAGDFEVRNQVHKYDFVADNSFQVNPRCPCDTTSNSLECGSSFILSESEYMASPLIKDGCFDYYSGGNSYTFEHSKVLRGLYVSGANSKVGVGTTTPAYDLDVDGVVNLTGDLYASGNVGIGTTNPIVPLDVNGAVRFGTRPRPLPVTETIGEDSFAAGKDTVASGQNSTAMGNQTTASGWHSTAMGSNTTASNFYSTAVGQSTTASGISSTAMGYKTTAYSSYSTAMGKNTIASGYVSTAMGHQTKVTLPGQFSTAMGDNTTASAHTSTAMGSHTAASGANSTAMGSYTIASGENSTAMGQNTTARAMGSVVIGRYNIIAGSPNAWQENDTLFVIGNGTSDATADRSNAMTVWKNGNVGIGTASPGYKLHVVGTAGLSTGSSWTNASDIRLKDIKGEYSKGLKELSQLRPVNFRYKVDNPRGLPSDEDYIGFVAQEVKEVFPEAVSEAEDGYLDFNIHAVNVAVVNAIKEQQQLIEELQAEVEALKNN